MTVGSVNMIGYDAPTLDPSALLKTLFMSSPSIPNTDSSRLRLVVFDLDGTLVNSLGAIIRAMGAACQSYGIAPASDTLVRQVIGLPLVEAVAQLHPQGEIDDHQALAELYKSAFADLRKTPDHEEPLYPGVIEALDALEGAGVLLGIATSKSMRGLRITLEAHSIKERFVTLQTGDAGLGKPHPDMLLRAVSEAGAQTFDTVMVGDTLYDLQMAHSARVPFLGVSGGYQSPEELKAGGADLIAGEFSDIPGGARSLFSS